MPAKPAFAIEPQRLAGHAWRPCPAHQAQRFALLALRHFSVNGKPAVTKRLVSPHRTMAEAQATMATQLAARKRNGHGYELGKPMPKFSGKALVRGLSSAAREAAGFFK